MSPKGQDLLSLSVSKSPTGGMHTSIFKRVFVVVYLLSHVRLLCPRDFPGKSTGVGCHFLLQGIFLTQGSNPGLLHWQADSLPLNDPGSPKRGWSRFKCPQFACGHGCMFCEHIEKHFGFLFFLIIGVSKIEFCSFF